MKTSDFDFTFPQELIAQKPSDKRDHSGLMILDRATKTIEHKFFFNLIDYLSKGDLLVLNDTKVIPANLVGRKIDSDIKIEVLIVKQPACRQAGQTTDIKQQWECLVKPGRKLQVGSKIEFGNGELIGEVIEKMESGEQIIEFEAKNGFWETIHRLGEMPLPPYINDHKKQKTNSKQQINNKKQLESRYQTVYACNEGAVAAPTAGLHFTPELLDKIRAKGINIAYVTLHTGLGTFLPVRVENIIDHQIHREYFDVPRETLDKIKQAKRVVAVGTTVVRALEANFAGHQGSTDLFIYPGYKFNVVDAMITNFHWPKSTLIMLVSAFAGKEFIMQAYEQAIKEQYHLFSFGDAMFIA